MEKQFIILLIKLAAAASIASILARSSKFLNLLLRERRTMLEQLQLSLGISGFCAAGSVVRIYTQSYAAADMCLEGSLLAGLIGGYVSGLITGVLCSIPALAHGEYLAMPLYAAVGVMGGLLRDLAYDQEEVWRISPFFDLSLYRLLRYPDKIDFQHLPPDNIEVARLHPLYFQEVVHGHQAAAVRPRLTGVPPLAVP